MDYEKNDVRYTQESDRSVASTSYHPGYKYDLKNPPDGYIYMPIVLSTDPFTDVRDVKHLANGSPIVYWTFSATELPCIMVLLEDTPEHRALERGNKRHFNTFCKNEERKRKYASEGRGSHVEDYISITGHDPVGPDSTYSAVEYKDLMAHIVMDLQLSGTHDLDVFRLMTSKAKKKYTQVAIAEKLGMSTSSVNESVKRIRDIVHYHYFV